MSNTAPSISNWLPLGDATPIGGQVVWLFQSVPNLNAAPPLLLPAGWELLLPAINAGVPGSMRYYAAIRQSTTPVPVAVVKAAPVATPIPAPAVPGAAYTVSASEVLFLTSDVTTGGVLQPRAWTFRGITKQGYNCGFWVAPTTPAGVYPLVESDIGGANPVSHAASVVADPYTTVPVPAGADLTPLIAGARDLTRYLLAANADYVIDRQPYAAQRLQIVGQAGTRVTVKPAIRPSGDWNDLFAIWLTTDIARVGLVNLTFLADTGGKFNSQGKTGTGAAYVPMGSLWAVDCTFDGMDFGVMADSTPIHQASGVLVQGCQWPDLYAQGVWIGGQMIDIDSCKGGPSRMEHPIRSSIVDLTTNQLPSFVRIANCTFDGSHASATSADPGKESAALRDGKYFYVQNNVFIGWAECGQGKPNAWDYFGEYAFEGNEFRDPATAPKTATLNVRAGVNGAGALIDNTAAMPIVVTAHVPPTLVGNKPK